MLSLADRVAAFERSGLEQREAARRAGIAPSVMSRYLKGERNLRPEREARLLDVLRAAATRRARSRAAHAIGSAALRAAAELTLPPMES